MLAQHCCSSHYRYGSEFTPNTDSQLLCHPSCSFSSVPLSAAGVLKGAAALRLQRMRAVQELFIWRFMQTDPNFGNFLYDEDSQQIALIDFGAARHFPKAFVDDYLRMVNACAQHDRDEIVKRSITLGFLTGVLLLTCTRPAISAHLLHCQTCSWLACAACKHL